MLVGSTELWTNLSSILTLLCDQGQVSAPCQKGGEKKSLTFLSCKLRYLIVTQHMFTGPALADNVLEAGSAKGSEAVPVSLCPNGAVPTRHGRGHTVGIQGGKLPCGAGFA